MRPARSGVGGRGRAKCQPWLSSLQRLPLWRASPAAKRPGSEANQIEQTSGERGAPPSGAVSPPAPSLGALGAAGEVPKPLPSLLRERPARCPF